MSSYCTPQDVASLLRLIDSKTQQRLTFSDSTDPTLAEVERIIEISAKELERMSGTAWRPVQAYELHDAETSYLGYTESLPVPLLHAPLCQMSSDAGDRLEIWNNDQWTDLLREGEEGRNKDYWIDYSSGIIYLVNSRPSAPDKSVRITYHYGFEDVPDDIRSSCAKLTACWYIESDFYHAGLPYGEGIPDPMARAARWREDVEKTIANRRIIGVGNL